MFKLPYMTRTLALAIGALMSSPPDAHLRTEDVISRGSGAASNRTSQKKRRLNARRINHRPHKKLNRGQQNSMGEWGCGPSGEPKVHQAMTKRLRKASKRLRDQDARVIGKMSAMGM